MSKREEDEERTVQLFRQRYREALEQRCSGEFTFTVNLSNGGQVRTRSAFVREERAAAREG